MEKETSEKVESKESSPTEKSPSQESKMTAGMSEEQLETFKNIDNRYKTDPNFRKVFDMAWKGEDVFAHKPEEKSAKEDVDDDPLSLTRKEVEAIKKKNEELEKKLSGLSNAYGWDKVSTVREKTNEKYESTFVSLAESAGYDYGSPAYDVLFKTAVHEGNLLAKKYNLVDDQGNPDPLLKFNPEFVKESFQKASEKIKAMGFDISEQKQKEMLKQKEANLQAENDEMEPFFDKKKLKTPADRARAMESAFNYRMRKLGVDPKSFKIV